MTLRAIRVLQEVDVVAAEDTRRTGNLLRHYQIRTPTISLHQHNERERADQILARLQAGGSVALVTDAGTPGISDPGANLVAHIRANGLIVLPVPGPSAVTALLSAAGVPAARFVFGGFPPVSGQGRRDWLTWVGGLVDIPVVFFEAPHRIRRSLTDLATILVDRQIVLGRELSKLHEQWLIGTCEDVESRLQEARGEFSVLVIPAIKPISNRQPPADGVIWDDFCQLTENQGVLPSEAVKHVAKSLGLPRRSVYAAIERQKQLADQQNDLCINDLQSE